MPCSRPTPSFTDAVRSTAARCLVVTGANPRFACSDDVKQVMAGAGERVSSGLRAEPWLTPPPTRPAHRRPGHRRSERRRGRLGHGAGPAGRHPHRAREGTVRRAVRQARLCCDVAGLGRLAGVIGRERAAELLFTGRIVGADEAAGMGLVSRVPHEDLLPAAGPRNRDAESPAVAQGACAGHVQGKPDRRALGVGELTRRAVSAPTTTARASPPSSRSGSRGTWARPAATATTRGRPHRPRRRRYYTSTRWRSVRRARLGEGSLTVWPGGALAW